jgi:hypothetical protein
MLHWIEVNVINVPPEIAFVTNEMFPKATLPEGQLPTSSP